MRVLVRTIAVLLTLGILPPLSGCSLGYYVQSARGQADLMSRRVPIESLLADPDTPPALRARLARVADARAYASEVLGLPADKGYRSYADLERRYAVWSVSATPEFSLEPESWCFPIAGCVSYRGYFRESAARDFAERLARRGLDVAVRGVAAYSTLGYFDDPVLNTMLYWDDAQLIAIVFHELAHQQVYAKDDTPFNESFASVVEAEGIRRYARDRGDAQLVQDLRRRRASEAAFSALLTVTRERLSALYASAMPAKEMRARKAAAFADLVARYEIQRDAGEISSAYDGWFSRELNNAHLAEVAVYRQWVPALEALLERTGGDLGAFYAEASRLGRLSRDARRIRLEALAAGQDQPGAFSRSLESRARSARPAR